MQYFAMHYFLRIRGSRPVLQPWAPATWWPTLLAGLFGWLILSSAALAERPANVAQAAEKPATPTVLILGDSLSAAYGIERSDGWVTLLQDRLERQGYNYRVVNASISGETTAGGLRRLPKQLERHDPALVVVELGANDGLRGQSLNTMRSNLRQIVQLSQNNGAAVLLLGMYIPANYGAAYVQKFHAVFVELAAELETGLVDFMLEPIAFDESNFLADRIHPNAAAQPALLEHLWPELSDQLVAPTTLVEPKK